jgi:hypothetical protein
VNSLEIWGKIIFESGKKRNGLFGAVGSDYLTRKKAKRRKDLKVYRQIVIWSIEWVMGIESSGEE